MKIIQTIHRDEYVAAIRQCLMMPQPPADIYQEAARIVTGDQDLVITPPMRAALKAMAYGEMYNAPGSFEDLFKREGLQ